MSRVNRHGSPSRQEAQARQRFAWWALVLAALALAAYLPAYRAGFIWDDDDYVTENSTLRDLDGLGRIWSDVRSIPQWYPLVHTTYWLEYHAWGLFAPGYHVVNVLLHIAGAILLARVLTKLGLLPPGPLIAAGILALHPVHVESVAWVTERKNVLSTVFYLSAALAYLRYYEPLEQAETARPWRWCVVAFVLYLCALLSKSVTASWPAAFLLVVWWKTGRIRWRQVWPLLPFFAAGIVMGALTAWLERYKVGADGQEFSLSVLERLLVAGRVPWFYLQKLLIPYPLAFSYGRWALDLRSPWPYIYPLATLVVILMLWLVRHRAGRGPLAAALFFLGTLAPVSGLFNVYPFRYSFVADHFQYVASIGLIVPAAIGLAWLAGRWHAAPAARLGATAAGLWMAALPVLAFIQCRSYRDLETLWRTTITRSPNAWLPQANLGFLLMQRGRNDEALGYLNRAVDLYANAYRPHSNLGDLHRSQGRPVAAERHYQRALAIEPDFAPALTGLAELYLQTAREEEAMKLLARAVQSHPHDLNTRHKHAVALMRLGRTDQALAEFREAVRRGPADLNSQHNLGAAMVMAGRPREAVEPLQAAVKLDPTCTDAWYQLGLALRQLNDQPRAVAAFARVIELDPHYGDANEQLRELQMVLRRNKRVSAPAAP